MVRFVENEIEKLTFFGLGSLVQCKFLGHFGGAVAIGRLVGGSFGPIGGVSKCKRHFGCAWGLVLVVGVAVGHFDEDVAKRQARCSFLEP